MIENIYETIIAESKKSEDNHQARRDAQTIAWFETHPECRQVMMVDDNEEPIYMGKPERVIREKEEIDIEKRIGASWFDRMDAGTVEFGHFRKQKTNDSDVIIIRPSPEYFFPKNIEIDPLLPIATDEDWVAEDKVIADKERKLTMDIQLVLEM